MTQTESRSRSWDRGPTSPRAKKPRRRGRSVRARLDLLLGAAPSVVYSFAASGDFAPTFVSANIMRHARLRSRGISEGRGLLARPRASRRSCRGRGRSRRSCSRRRASFAEYRFRKKDGSYCWVSDEQHLIRDLNEEPLEVVGSWSNIDAPQGGGAGIAQRRKASSKRRPRRRSRQTKPRAPSLPI